MKRLIYPVLIGLLLIISLILGILFISEKIENKRLTEEIEGWSDYYLELDSISEFGFNPNW